MVSSPASELDQPAGPTFADIEAARSRLAGKAVVTPLIESPELNDRVGIRVLLKVEMLQRTGSFKFRGAYNKISQLAAGPRRPPAVVAYSSGNHAQGVAAAARLAGLPAIIVMPGDAPAVKIDNTRAHGAEVVLYDRQTQQREAIAAAIAAERGAAIVPPFDDRDVIAGQGTTGYEIAEQAKAMGVTLDTLLVPCSGGGLTAGCALAMAELSPATRVYTVEPTGLDDTAHSLRVHRRVANQGSPNSPFCDGLGSKTPGEITFGVNDRLVAGGLSVDDDEVAAAMALAFRVLKLVIEPSGAVGLAATLSRKIGCPGQTLGIVCSGGNVDPETFCRVLGHSASA